MSFWSWLGLDFDPGDVTKPVEPEESVFATQTYARDLGTLQAFADISAIYRCVTLISNDVAGTPFEAVRRVGTAPVAPNSGAANFNRLMGRKLDGDPPYVFKRDLVADRLLYGNAYMYMLRGPSGRVLDLIRIPAFGVRVSRHSRTARVNPGRKYYSVTLTDGPYRLEPRVYEEDEVIHVRSVSGSTFNLDQGSPVVPIRAPDALISATSDERVRTMLETGNLSPVAVMMDLTAFGGTSAGGDEALLEWFESLASEQPLLAGGVADVKPTGATPQSTDMKELREQADERIAMRFGVPAPLIGRGVTQWGTGISELNRLYMRGAIKHVLNEFAEVFTFSLMDASAYKVRYDMRNLLKGDYTALAEVGSKLAGANHTSVLTIDELRDDQDLPPIPGGSVLVPSAMPSVDTPADDDEPADEPEPDDE